MRASKFTGKFTLAKSPWFWERNNPSVISVEILDKVHAIYSYFMVAYCFIWVAPKHPLKVKGCHPVSLVTSFCIWAWWQSCSRMPACCLLPPCICSNTSLSQQRSPQPCVAQQYLSPLHPSVCPRSTATSTLCVRSLAASLVFCLKSLLTPVGLLWKTKRSWKWGRLNAKMQIYLFK